MAEHPETDGAEPDGTRRRAARERPEGAARRSADSTSIVERLGMTEDVEFEPPRMDIEIRPPDLD